MVNRVLSLGLIFAASVACVSGETPLPAGLDTRGGAIFAAAVKMDTRRKKKRNTDSVWNEATYQGARLEAEAVRSAQSSTRGYSYRPKSYTYRPKSSTSWNPYKYNSNRNGWSGQTRKYKAPKSYWNGQTRRKSTNRSAAQQVAARRRAAAATRSRSGARRNYASRTKNGVNTFTAVNFDRGFSGYQGNNRNGMWGPRRRRVPQTIEETRSTTTTTVPETGVVRRRRRRWSARWKGRNGLKNRFFETALVSVITLAALTSVSDIMSVAFYENRVYNDLSFEMMLGNQRILSAIMELGSALLMLHPQLRQLGAFFITVMYTGSLISIDLEVWETVISGAIAAMALYVFACEMFSRRDFKRRRL